MKSSNATKMLCLFWVMTLIMGLMIGCRQAQNTGSTTTPPTSSTEPSTHFQVGPYETDPSIGDITLIINALSDNAYYPISSLWAMNKISLPDAWDISTGSSTVRVGIIDTGIDASHPDLINRVNTTLSESFIDSYSPLEDQKGHGTHIAGIIGAQGDNAIGTTGVCWDVELVSLRVCNNQGEVDAEAFIDAIESANSKGIDILNISINCWFSNPDSTEYDERLESALSDFDGLIVCSSGNADPEKGIPFDNDTAFNFPANFHLDNLISVGASTNTDALADFSCFGELTVDIFAPGTSIINCYPSELCCNDSNCNAANHTNQSCNASTHLMNGYHNLSGTSMAAPHVAGVAALLLSIHPELTPAELKQIIMSSVDIVYDADGNSVFGDICVSGGRLNAYKALTTTSIHNFGSWSSVNGVIHARTCTTCGYTQTGYHSDSWDDLLSRCIVCRYKGIAVAPIEKVPDLPIAETADSAA